MRLANQDWDLSLMEGITDYYLNLEYKWNLKYYKYFHNIWIKIMLPEF